MTVVERIFTSPTPGAPQLEQASIRVVAGSGIAARSSKAVPQQGEVKG